MVTSQLCRWHSLVVAKSSTLLLWLSHLQITVFQPIRETAKSQLCWNPYFVVSQTLPFTFLLFMAVKWAKWFLSHCKKSPRSAHPPPCPWRQHIRHSEKERMNCLGWACAESKKDPGKAMGLLCQEQSPNLGQSWSQAWLPARSSLSHAICQRHLWMLYPFCSFDAYFQGSHCSVNNRS